MRPETGNAVQWEQIFSGQRQTIPHMGNKITKTIIHKTVII